jgi:hypothetical protein
LRREKGEDGYPLHFGVIGDHGFSVMRSQGFRQNRVCITIGSKTQQGARRHNRFNNIGGVL